MYTKTKRGFKTCIECGASLDPQESCDCQEKEDFIIPDCIAVVYGAKRVSPADTKNSNH